MRIIRGIFGLAFAVLFAAFAVANRHSVDVYWHPFYPPLSVPFYILALVLPAAGFILGWVAGWLNSLPVRWTKRKLGRQIKSLEKEMENLKEKGSFPVVIATPKII